METEDSRLKDELLKTARLDESDDYDTLVTTLAFSRFRNILSAFILSKEHDVNFQYWWQYMHMVCVLLMFIRAQRDGIWELHLCAFQQMLPFFHRYDHTNYARWGCVYLAEMKQLPTAVKDEFLKGNFVVKGSDQTFNQVDPDHSQEWLNGTGKRGGGIIGITRTTSALSRWALSYNLRACIAVKTRALFMAGHDDQMVHNETTPARTKMTMMMKTKLYHQFYMMKVMAPDPSCEALQNISTKDLATADIQESLVSAEHLGQMQVNAFVNDRFITSGAHTTNVKFRAPLHKSKERH